jgi:tetratricopeptide (TPR) repeat protein
VITAEPSNPWIAGIANLYTREFYQVIKSKIKDDGIFAQWFHNYSMSPDDFRMVFRTFAEAFPHVSLWSMKESDFLLIGSKQEHKFDYAAVKAVFDKNPKLRSDFEYLGLSDVYAAQGFYRMDREGFVNFSKGAAINTDDGAELEFSAPKNLRRSDYRAQSQAHDAFPAGHPAMAEGQAAPGGAADASLLYGPVLSRQRGAGPGAEVKSKKRFVLDPKNPKFHLLHMKILLEQDKSTEGAKAAFNALQLAPDSAPEVLAMSDEFYLPEAKAVYSKIISMGHKEVLPYLGLGNIALHSGDVVEAEKWFVQARSLQPEHPAVLLAWGRLIAAKAIKLTDEAK